LSFQYSEILIFISFKLNQDYIAKNLCVEKDIENSTCKGCCQLKKKLDEQHQKKEQIPPTENSKNNIDYCNTESHKLLLFLQKKIIEEKVLYSLYSKLFHFKIFHPPRF